MRDEANELETFPEPISCLHDTPSSSASVHVIEYADGQLLHFLSPPMKVRVTHFLKIARGKGHTVQPLPSAHLAPYPHRDKSKKKKAKILLSKDAIRIVYIGENGYLRHPDDVPIRTWTELAMIARDAGLAPGLFAPHGDKTYFALHKPTTVHGEKTKEDHGEGEGGEEKEKGALKYVEKGNNVAKLWQKRGENVHSAMDAIVAGALKQLKAELKVKAMAQLEEQVAYMKAKGVKAGTITKWRKAAETEIAKQVEQKDLKNVGKELEKTLSKGKAKTVGRGNHSAVDKAHHSMAEDLAADTEETVKGIEDAEKIEGKLKIAGRALIAIEIVTSATEIVLHCVEHPQQWPKIAVEEGLEEAAGIGVGLAGAWAGGEAGAAVGAAIGVWAFGIGAVPGAMIGGMIGSLVGGGLFGELGEKVGKKGMKKLEKTKVGSEAVEALEKELEKLFPPKDTHLSLTQKGKPLA